jgi:hypothetical protein
MLLETADIEGVQWLFSDAPFLHSLRFSTSAMLAFLLATFGLPRNKEQLRYLTDRFYDSYWRIETPFVQLSHLMLWLLMIGSMTVFDVDNPWLRSQWIAFISPQLSWEEVRQRLQSIAWIDRIHDKAGQRIYSKLTLRE